MKVVEFVVVVEYDPDRIDASKIENKLADSLAWVEGVGWVDVRVIGDLDPPKGTPPVTLGKCCE